MELNVKNFVKTSSEYCQNQSEDGHDNLYTQLQTISEAVESVFDPHSNLAIQFCVSLHELMGKLDRRSTCLWEAIHVLSHACRKYSARTLIQAYNFVPILTEVLRGDLNQPEKERVLRLLQDLTYGIKTSWQEVYLHRLIPILKSWIMTEDEEVITLSLEVLVNLCYKNLPSVDILLQSVEKNDFLHSLLKVRKNNNIQVCKMLIILEHISETYEADILHFVHVTFSEVGSALEEKKGFRLKQMVDFFKDLAGNDRSREVLLKYDRFQDKTEQLLSVLDDRDSHSRTVAVLLELLQSLIRLRINELYIPFPRLITSVMYWLSHSSACTQSLQLIRSVVMETRDCGSNEVQENILEQLDHGFPMLLEIIREEFPLNAATCTQLTALLQLLQEMTKTPLLKEKFHKEVNPQNLQKIFEPLLSVELRERENLFEEEVTVLYVHALDLIADFVSLDVSWLNLYSELLLNKQVQAMLAVGLLTGKEEIKRCVLMLAGTVGFPNEGISLLAKSLCDLQPLVPINPALGKRGGSCSVQEYDMPFFSSAQEGRLGKIMGELEQACQNNQISDHTTDVMELYDYRLLALRQSERKLKESLEAANSYSTHLEHRLAQMSAEAGKLHQLLYRNKQCIQFLEIEKETLTSKNEALKQSAKEERNKLIDEMKRKPRELDDLTSENNDLKRSLNSKNEEPKESKDQENVSKELEDSATQLDAMNENCKELTKALRKLEDRVAKKEKVINDKDAEIKKLKQDISALNNKVEEMERIREMIIGIAAGKKKMDK